MNRPPVFRRPPRVRGGDVLTGALIGAGLGYVLTVPHPYAHAYHWLSSAGTGLIGAGVAYLILRRQLSRAARPTRAPVQLRKARTARTSNPNTKR